MTDSDRARILAAKLEKIVCPKCGRESYWSYAPRFCAWCEAKFETPPEKPLDAGPRS